MSELPLLTDEELALLTPEELDAYLAMLEADSKEWRLTPKQALADDLADRVDELLFGGAAGGGKLLRCDEPIPTPSGWTTMGDLAAGDEVLDERGFPCVVVHAFDVVERPDAWRLTFDDGTEIEAGAEHRWLTYDAAELAALTRRDPEWRAARRARRPSRVTGNRSAIATAATIERNKRLAPPAKDAPTGTIRTTKEIAETLTTARGRRNHAVPVTAALDLPVADLPLDPYVLGVWLGDGTARASTVTMLAEDWLYVGAEFEKAGWVSHPVPSCAHKSFSVHGLITTLKKMGLYGNKHVPAQYLRGSIEQRLALVQGLMDTDGTVAKASGSAEFCTTSPALRDGMHELIVSLGWKVRVREGRAKLNGRGCGPKWTLKWMADRPVFRLPRKADIQSLGTRRTTRFRYVIAAEPCEPAPMRCIAVDSPSHLYLAGRAMVPTHNSEMAVYHANRWSKAIPGHRTLVLRSSFPELRRTLIARSLMKLLPHVTSIDGAPATYRVGDKEWHYANGSVIEFGFAETYEDVRQYLSAEYELIVIDESTDFTWEQIEMLRSRLRTSKKKRALGCRPHLLLLTNPGGVGHAEHKKRYVTPTMGGKRVAKILDNPSDPLSERTVAFVPSKVSDNPHMDPAYELSLRSLSDPVKREQYLNGSWDVFEGMFFAEYDRTIHEIAPFEIPKGWPRIRAIDFGTSAPFCCHWIGFDQDGNAYVYREVYGTNLTAKEQAKIILSQTGSEKIDYTVADPSIWARTGTGVSIAQVYREAGLNCRKAMNARVDGWNRVREYLRGSTDPKDPAYGSFLRIMAVNCPNLARTFPEAQRDRNRQDDLDTNGEDHALDALRYGLMSRPRKAKKPPDDRYTGEPRAGEDIADFLKNRDKGRHPVLGKL